MNNGESTMTRDQPMTEFAGASNPVLTQLAEKQTDESFNDHCEVTEQEALGVALAHHFQWEGNPIMETFMAALEDANYHTEAAQVAEWLE